MDKDKISQLYRDSGIIKLGGHRKSRAFSNTGLVHDYYQQKYKKTQEFSKYVNKQTVKKKDIFIEYKTNQQLLILNLLNKSFKGFAHHDHPSGFNCLKKVVKF